MTTMIMLLLLLLLLPLLPDRINDTSGAAGPKRGSWGHLCRRRRRARGTAGCDSVTVLHSRMRGGLHLVEGKAAAHCWQRGPQGQGCCCWSMHVVLLLLLEMAAATADKAAVMRRKEKRGSLRGEGRGGEGLAMRCRHAKGGEGGVGVYSEAVVIWRFSRRGAAAGGWRWC